MKAIAGRFRDVVKAGVEYAHYLLDSSITPLDAPSPQTKRCCASAV